MYKIEIKKKALKELSKLPTEIIDGFYDKFLELSKDPYNVSGIKPIKNPKGLGIKYKEAYRARVGDYRAIYAIENDVLIIHILRIAHRKEVYE
jgi:mRNA interferase RelE/StbE